MMDRLPLNEVLPSVPVFATRNRLRGSTAFIFSFWDPPTDEDI